MLVSYKAPWGKAGGGAPNNNVSYQAVRQTDRQTNLFCLSATL